MNFAKSGLFPLMIFGTFASVSAREPSDEARVAIRSEISRAYAEKLFTGAAFGWWQTDGVYAEEYFGLADANSIFDLASLTKPVFTTSLIALLVDRGKMQWDDTVASLLPAWKGCPAGFPTRCATRAQIRVRDLLRHTSGLSDGAAYSGDLSFSRKVRRATERREDWQSALPTLLPADTPRMKFVYQDINFILLLEVGRAVLRKVEPTLTAEAFVQRELYVPLAMQSTFLHDLPPVVRDRQIPTMPGLARGIIHDPVARLLPETAGNAGLFSTLPDLLRFVPALLVGSYFSEATLQEFATPDAIARRGLGWDVASDYATSLRGNFREGFGHTGYTGTSIWVVPQRRMAFVLLTNRSYLEGGATDTAAGIKDLRAKIANLIFEACATSKSPCGTPTTRR